MTTVFDPPGPGRWALDRSHFDGGTTPSMQALMTEAMGTALEPAFRQLGVPADTVDCRWVHGFMYTRLRPLVSPDKPSAKAPPAAAVWLLARLHPEFRRRNAAAVVALEDSPVPSVIEEWWSTTEPAYAATNLRLGAIELDSLDTETAHAHLLATLTHCRATFREHFRLHAYDLGPIGAMIDEVAPWGLTSAEVVAALVGASPSTSEPIDALAAIHAAVRDAGVEPAALADLDALRAVSDDAAEQLDRYLERRGDVLYAGYDLESPTLGEVPDIVLATIVATDRPAVDHAEHAAATAAQLRARVPSVHRARFDELLSDARESMDLRDANGPITIEWPTGLLRKALLAWGRTLVDDGRLTGEDAEPALVFELTLAEIEGGASAVPATATLLERRSTRHAQRRLAPPAVLGPEEIAPAVSLLPDGLRRLITMTETVMAELGMAMEDETPRAPLDGVGVGDRAVTGPARVVDSAEEALDALLPGEILVTRATSPAYNMVLTLVDGLVTADGGAMSHAAVLSRELGIPAVIGAPGALDRIRTGDEITVDPVTGRVTVTT